MKRLNKSMAALILAVVIILSALAGCLAGFGVGKEHKGKASHILLGLDLAGGVSISYEAQGGNPSDKDMNDTVYKLQKRVEAYSTEAEVYREGSNRINVEIPGVTDADKILEELGQPGALVFATVSGEGDEQQFTPVLTGSDVANAEATSNSTNGVKEYVVDLEFTAEGAKKFADATEANIGNQIYIFYDNQVVSAPTVQTAITEGRAQITGMENYDAANELATTIRIGALPLELKEVHSTVVSAKLGREAVTNSLKAGAIGFAAIVVLMIVLYLFPGFVAALALTIYVILMLLALNGLNVTLTLPGIAGIILSIGMAVDANVIIFNRIKEEIGLGKDTKYAIVNGFDKAFSAIIDGNVTTLIAAAVLWFKGSGSVKGFASTLAIGIVLSMFTAFVVTKLLINVFYQLGVKNPKLYGSKKPAKVIDWIKISKVCGAISLVVIIVGLVFLPINKKNTGKVLNYSLDFSGGTSLSITFDEKQTADSDLADQVKTEVADMIDDKNIETQIVKDDNQIILKTTQELDLEQRTKIEEKIREDFKVAEFEKENISSSVSKEMRSDAVIAVIIAIILMLIYIAIRFKDIRFGAGAVLALVHDVLIVFCLYSVFKFSVGGNFIACMLTIVGYSINATIIIYDRIRENLKAMSRKKDGYAAIVNTSISQTLTRTIATSLTTFITVAILYIFAVPSIKEFIFSLMAGVVVGVYSSVCLTGPIWYFLRTKFGRQ